MKIKYIGINLIISYIIDAGLVSCQYYDPSPLVPMSQYTNDYRTLSCYECWFAQGRMCVSRTSDTMFDYTGSTNYNHGICCKTGVTSNVCSQTNDWS